MRVELYCNKTLLILGKDKNKLILKKISKLILIHLTLALILK